MSSHLLRLSAALASFFAVIAAAVYLWPRPILLAAIYLGAAVAFLSWTRRREDVLYYLVPLTVAPAGEAVAVAHGAWHYTGVAGIPVWLPFAWGIAGLCMRQCSVAVNTLLRWHRSRLRRKRTSGAPAIPTPPAGIATPAH
jgi:hypothetical protein